jgi:deoxyribodipyrimidine photo-lyase
VDTLSDLAKHPRTTVRRPGHPDPEGKCVVYWMQRAQRAIDNPALDVAVDAGNALQKAVVVFFAPVPFYPHANLRHYHFLKDGIPEIASGLAKRNIGFVLRRFPEHSLVRFCEEVKPALVIGDENPMREPESWRVIAAKKLRVPLWTVDADVIVPSKLLEKAQYSAHIIQPRLDRHLADFLLPPRNPRAQFDWQKPKSLLALPPDSDISEGWQIDRSVSPLPRWHGGTTEAHRWLGSLWGTNCAATPGAAISPRSKPPAGCLLTCISARSAR